MASPSWPAFRRPFLCAALFVCASCSSSQKTTPFDAGAPDLTTLDLAVLDATIADAAPDLALVDARFSDDGPPAVLLGAPDRLLFYGTIVSPDETFEGTLLVEGQLITCVERGGGCVNAAGAGGATVIHTDGVIAPGLIDTHNHILFDIFDDDDWVPTTLSTNHNQWTSDPRYAAMLDVKQCLVDDSQGKPGWCANTPYGTAIGSLRCEIDKYGELKGLVAGTTSIVGLPGQSAACFSSVARSIDDAQSGLAGDAIQTSATFPPSKATGDSVCANFASGATQSYLVHCGEGIDAAALAEFTTLGTLTTKPGCLKAPPTAITHGTAFGPPEFAAMAQAGMKLTWSPQSNVSLYGQTANIPAARAAGVTVALAPDWSMGGSQNLLDELRFAHAWDVAHWGGQLSSHDLVQMVTSNAASVLALGDKLGQLKVGYLADIAVYAANPSASPTPVPSPSTAYDTIIEATPAQTELVMVGGSVLYGNETFAEVGRSQHPGCETLEVCRAHKFLCLRTGSTTDKLDQSYTEIKAAISAALVAADAQTPGDGWNFAPITPLVKCH